MRTRVTGWCFVIAAVVLICLFYFYPMIQAFNLSLKSGVGTNLQYVGFENYKRLFTDSNFITAVTNTFIYLIVQVPIMIILALLLSVDAEQRQAAAQGAVPHGDFSPVRHFPGRLLGHLQISVRERRPGQSAAAQTVDHRPAHPAGSADPFWAKVTIILAITWRWTGYNMIFYLSALQNIDRSIYEAATIDGASAFGEFTKITVPLLKPIILFTSIMSTIGTLQLFDEVMNITKGGPGNATMSISQYIYNLSFKYTPDFGYAATVSYAIVVLIVIFSYMQFKVAGDR